MRNILPIIERQIVFKLKNFFLFPMIHDKMKLKLLKINKIGPLGEAQIKSYQFFRKMTYHRTLPVIIPINFPAVSEPSVLRVNTARATLDLFCCTLEGFTAFRDDVHRHST